MSALRQNPNAPRDEERTARVEQLLRLSAEWEPERDAPVGLTERALARLERKSPLSRWLERHRLNLSGLGLGTVAVAAGLTLLALRPNATLMPSPTGALASYTYTKGSEAAEASLPRPKPAPVVAASLTVPTETGTARVEDKPTPEARPAVARRESPRNVARNRRESKRPSSHQRRPVTEPRLWREMTREMMAEIKKEAVPDSAPIWQEEPEPSEEYRVVVPVLFAETTADDSDLTAVPAVVEMTFPKAAKAEPNVPPAGQPNTQP